MIERKIKMQKDEVIKEIPENLVSDYSFMGWTKVEERISRLEKPRFDRKSFDKE